MDACVGWVNDEKSATQFVNLLVTSSSPPTLAQSESKKGRTAAATSIICNDATSLWFRAD